MANACTALLKLLTEQPPTGAGVPGDDARGRGWQHPTATSSRPSRLNCRPPLPSGTVRSASPFRSPDPPPRPASSRCSRPGSGPRAACRRDWVRSAGTNSAKRKVCVARLVLRFQRVTWPLLPPSTTVWPSGRNDTASATDPSRAGKRLGQMACPQVDDRERAIAEGVRQQIGVWAHRVAWPCRVARAGQVGPVPAERPPGRRVPVRSKRRCCRPVSRRWRWCGRDRASSPTAGRAGRRRTR